MKCKTLPAHLKELRDGQGIRGTKLKESTAILKLAMKVKEKILDIESKSLLNGKKGKAVNGTKDKQATLAKEYGAELDSKIAAQLRKLYAEIEVVYVNGQVEMRRVLDGLSEGMAMFQLSNKRKQEFETRLRKARPELDGTKIDDILKSIEEFSEQEAEGNEKLMKKLELLALHWTLKGNVILPEDGSKIMDALHIADKNKFDPFSYNSPNEITESFAKVDVKAKPLNPDNYLGKGYSNKQEWAEGVTVYDVDNNDTGRKISRAMIDTHFGKNANPWCLLARKNGDIKETATFWYNTYPGEKKIAFKDGKLIGFYGGDEWWDRMDSPSEGVKLHKTIHNYNNTEYTALTAYEVVGDTVGSSYTEKLILGNTKNGEYKEYAALRNRPAELLMEVVYKNGAKDGTQIEYYARDTQISKTTIYKNGVKEGVETIYDDDGNKIQENSYSNNVLHGPVRVYSKQTRELFSEQLFKNGVKDGKYTQYYKGGNVEIIAQYSKGKKNGAYTKYYRNGGISDKSVFKNDKHAGTSYYYYMDGALGKTIPYKDGEMHGEVLSYSIDGSTVKVKDIYKEGTLLRRITYNKDSTIKEDRPFNKVHMQQGNNVIKGAAVLDKNKILIDLENRSTDTLAHEYAHFYIAAFRETPIVQGAIKKWGSEEALVQAIGEQVVEQKGEAYGWWKKFSNWVKGLFYGLDNKSKEELAQLLTDAFLTRMDLNDSDGERAEMFKEWKTKSVSKDKKGRIYEAKKEAENAIPDEGCGK